ncbi:MULTISPECIES: hypothetical protein [unclassified Streptomyces]|nr:MULTISPECIES: hypothetical protein [unclassified Streptomyces]MCX4391645.1 hypothetical protein [Streptomyces sp. NBC_01767]MCX5165180.1 hypothetical protein [Streptomyces sp. NBC_00305]MCX5223703.1 hypothetical protein [Streptomyces sp. NBC_00264]
MVSPRAVVWGTVQVRVVPGGNIRAVAETKLYRHRFVDDRAVLPP